MAFKTLPALVASLILMGAPAAADQLFVLHERQASASVFDAQTLEPLGSAPAPAGVFRVLGLPDAPGLNVSQRFYLVGARSIVITDGDFQQIGSIELPAPAIRADHGAALSPDGSRLLVATNFGVLMIDTATNEIVDRLVPGFPVGGVALLPDAGKAWVFSDGAPVARVIDIATDTLVDEVAVLPAPLSSVSRSANGLHAYGLAGQGVYELDEIETVALNGASDAVVSNAVLSGDPNRRLTVFGSGAPEAPAAAEGRLAVTDSARFFLAASGSLSRAMLNGSGASTLVNAPSGDRLDLSRTLWAASTDGSQVFLATLDGSQITAVDPADLSAARSASLSDEATGVELVAPRIQQAGTLELLTTQNSFAAGGTYFEVQVRASNGSGAPDANVPVFASNVTPPGVSVNCLSTFTNNDGVATLECLLGEVTENRNLQITISDAKGRTAPILSITAVPPTAEEGLAKIEGDGQRVPGDSEFSFTVLLSRNRLPAPGETLRVTVSPVDREIFGCVPQTVTDADGMATITCTAEDIPNRENISVTVTHLPTDDSVTFGAIIDQAAKEPGRIIRIAGHDQTVVQGSYFTITAQVTDLAGFAPIVNVLVSNNQANPPGVTCPSNGAIDEDGFTTIRCQAGSIQGDQTTSTIDIAHFGTRLAEPFGITIVRTAPGTGGVDSFHLLTEEEFEAVPGVPLPNAIQIQVLNARDQPSANVNVYFSSPGDVVFDPPVASTDAEGIATTTVTVGCSTQDIDIYIGREPNENFIDVEADVQSGGFAELEIVQGNNQSGGPGQRLDGTALVARATDICGNEIALEEVSWRVRPAHAATLRSTINISDSAGRVSTLVTLGQVGGPFKVTVGNEIASADFDLAVNLPSDELQIRSGDGQNGQPGQALPQPLVVQAVGITGFGIGGVPIQWSASGAAQILNSAATTDATGVAFARVRVGTGGDGTGQVTATGLGGSVTFSINGSGKPVAPVEAFVNGASFTGGWTPGSTGTIFGQALAPELTVATEAPFPTSLNGVTVTINGAPAPLIFVSPGQINLQVPFDAAVAPATVVINNNGESTTVQNVPINAVQPGIFVNGQIAAALHADFSPITEENPVLPGQAVQLYFTGGGPLSPAVNTNTPGPSNPLAFTVNDVVVGVDSSGQQVLAAVYAPGLITAYQVNFVLGNDIQPGLRDLSIVINGVSSQTVKLPVGAAQ